jgi:hypothetical protein
VLAALGGLGAGRWEVLSLAAEQVSYHPSLRHQHHFNLAGSFDFVSDMASQGWRRERVAIQRVLVRNFEG